MKEVKKPRIASIQIFRNTTVFISTHRGLLDCARNHHKPAQAAMDLAHPLAPNRLAHLVPRLCLSNLQRSRINAGPPTHSTNGSGLGLSVETRDLSPGRARTQISVGKPCQMAQNRGHPLFKHSTRPTFCQFSTPQLLSLKPTTQHSQIQSRWKLPRPPSSWSR